MMARNTRLREERSFLLPALARVQGCCSIQNHLAMQTGLPIQVTRLANIFTTPRVPGWAELFLLCSIAKDIMKMGLAACMCIRRGGSIIKSLTFPAVTILNMAAVLECPCMDFNGESKI